MNLVNVISAAIEYDQAKCIVYPILFTAIAFAIPSNENTTVMREIIGLPLIFIVYEFARGIPRNAFIKKVIECISEEQSHKK